MLRRAALGITFALALVGVPRSTDACSCGFVAPYITPADGAIGVPVNVRPQILLALDNPLISVRLTDGTNDIAVAIEQREASRWFVVTPGPLAPDTRYSLVVEDASLGGGITWSSEFTTGSGLDTIAPAPAKLTAWSPETMDYPISNCSSSCIYPRGGYISRIGLGIADVPPDAVMLAVEVDNGGTKEIIAYEPGTIGDVVNPNGCSPASFSLARNAETCGRLHVVDAAGNTSTSERVCSVTSVCAKRGAGTDGCQPSRECEPIEPADGCTTSSSSPAAGLAAVALALAARRRGRKRRSIVTCSS